MSKIISPNTTIAQYSIVSKIGEGGMGVVWRARDTKLGRDVAIKVLPASLSENTERLNRFEQEAQTAGALNHPNILVIHHIGLHDGAPYIVSELLEGETLRERMNGTALPQRKAIDYALQIARGLAAAHEKGIVHRDIKPDNIFVTNDGRVKILDFGLAKLLPRRGDGVTGGVGEEDPTIAQSPRPPVSPSPLVKTDPGTVMGTVGYMSPEQLRGQNADARSDIFSFGAVFYEMLSGKRAFQRNSMAETMSAILKEDPPELSTTNATVSTALERVVQRSIEKNPEQRFHSASDLAFAIEALSSPSTPSGSTSTVLVPTVAGRRNHNLVNSSRLWMIVAAILTVGLIGLVLYGLSRRTNNVAVPVVRFDVAPLNKTGLSLIRYPAVIMSPDGSTLAFLAASDGVSRLYLRRRDDTEIRMIPGTERAMDATFSADGQWIAFVADFTLKKVPLNGPVVSLTKVGDSRGVSWMPDDSLVYSPDATGGVFQISTNGGEPHAITKVDEAKRERTHRWPQALPGGKAVLFTVGTQDKPDDYDNANIEAVVLATGERKLILQGASVAHYVPTGHLIFARDGVLYAVGFDIDKLAVNGKPVSLTVGVAGDKTTGAVHFAISNDGTLAYLPGSNTSGLRRLTWVDKKGNPTEINIQPAQFNDVQISPDESRVALIQGSSMSGDVWVYDVARSTLTRLTFTTTNATPIWSADSKYLYYTSTDSSGSTIFRKPADGSQEAEKVVSINHQAYLKGILPDGETALLDASRQTADANISTIALKPDAKPTTLVNTQFMEYGASASPNGRWLAYQSNESGIPEIYVRDLAGSGGRWPISTGGGEEPRWAPDGKELYYRVNGQLMAVPVDTSSSFHAGTPFSLFNEVYDLRSNTGQTYAVDPRGGRFLMIRPPKEDTSVQIRIVLNWFEELRRLVPTK